MQKQRRWELRRDISDRTKRREFVAILLGFKTGEYIDPSPGLFQIEKEGGSPGSVLLICPSKNLLADT